MAYIYSKYIIIYEATQLALAQFKKNKAKTKNLKTFTDWKNKAERCMIKTICDVWPPNTFCSAGPILLP